MQCGERLAHGAYKYHEHMMTNDTTYCVHIDLLATAIAMGVKVIVQILKKAQAISEPAAHHSIKSAITSEL